GEADHERPGPERGRAGTRTPGPTGRVPPRSEGVGVDRPVSEDNTLPGRGVRPRLRRNGTWLPRGGFPRPRGPGRSEAPRPEGGDGRPHGDRPEGGGRERGPATAEAGRPRAAERRRPAGRQRQVRGTRVGKGRQRAAAGCVPNGRPGGRRPAP